MTYVSTHHHESTCQDEPSIGQLQSTVVKFIYSVGYLIRGISRRRHLKTLGQLSDEQLSDIGLHRDDIFEAKNLSYRKDVTCHLAEIARRRRRNFARPAVRIYR